MDVKMIHFLTSLLSIIDYNTKTFGQILFSCNLFGNHQEVTKQLQEKQNSKI